MVLSNIEFERQYAAATRRGNRRLAQQPVADAVRYDRRLRKVVIELSNGCTLLVPPERTQGLSEASPRDLARAKILGPGTSIEWPSVDVQLSVAGLLAGRFGTQSWMAQRSTANGTRKKRQAKRKAAPKR
jgi:hypothetical protein